MYVLAYPGFFFKQWQHTYNCQNKVLKTDYPNNGVPNERYTQL